MCYNTGKSHHGIESPPALDTRPVGPPVTIRGKATTALKDVEFDVVLAEVDEVTIRGKATTALKVSSTVAVIVSVSGYNTGKSHHGIERMRPISPIHSTANVTIRGKATTALKLDVSTRHLTDEDNTQKFTPTFR